MARKATLRVDNTIPMNLLAGKDAYNAPEGFKELVDRCNNKHIEGTFYGAYKKPTIGLVTYFLQSLPEISFEYVSALSDSLQVASFNNKRSQNYKYSLTNYLAHVSRELTEAYNALTTK